MRDLERKFRRQLNSARAATSEERIPDAHVAGGAQSESARPNLAIAIYIESLLAWIGDEQRQEGTGKVWMIQKIEELRS